MKTDNIPVDRFQSQVFNAAPYHLSSLLVNIYPKKEVYLKTRKNVWLVKLAKSRLEKT